MSRPLELVDAIEEAVKRYYVPTLNSMVDELREQIPQLVNEWLEAQFTTEFSKKIAALMSEKL